MTNIMNHEPGTFCWTDLATTDHNAAKKFYSNLFGWEAKDLPVEKGTIYTIFLTAGREVCGLYPMMKDQKEQGVPAHWLAYISVTDANEIAAKVQSSGGRVLEGAFDVMDAGRMAVLQDPSGATFAIWQPKKHVGARIQEVPGTVCWRELITQEIERTGRFYSEVFGWTIDTDTFKNKNYILLKKDENGIGGMLTVPNAKNHWLTYWIVENCDQIASKSKSLGGQILKEPTKIPDIGRFAILSDPQGAAFAIMQGDSLETELI